MSQLVGRLAAAYQRRGGKNWSLSAEFESVLNVLSDEYSQVGDAAQVPPVDERLAVAAAAFGLDGLDAQLLWSVSAPDVDINIGMAYALLRGVPGIARVSVGLALELARVPTLSSEGHKRLGPASALRRNGLVDTVGSDPWLVRELTVPSDVVAALLGSNRSDPVVDVVSVSVVPLDVPDGDAIASAIASGVTHLWVNDAATGAVGANIAAGAVAKSGRSWLAADLRRCPAGHRVADIVAALCRAAGMAGRALILDGADALAGPDRDIFDTLAEVAIPIIVVGSRPWVSLRPGLTPLVIEAQPVPLAARAHLWTEHLGSELAADGELASMLLGLRYTPTQIAAIARYARALAMSRSDNIDVAMIVEAARRVGGAGASRSSKVKVTSASGFGPRFGDLIVPEQVIGELSRLVGWGRHRDEISTRGALRRSGQGISALFAGSPGTGKSLAAHVVAEELSMGLFQVELSSVIDKYIGETEKNLEEIFLEAESANVMLFFDEADALFGARSAVRDSRDRYANQEVAYLLQRMEHFNGIVVLATNLRGNLDQAFTRRMSFVITFPDPDVAIRRQLWSYHLRELSTLDEADPVDVDYLAHALKLTGGDIRNIVLAAAYDALSAGQHVGMRHIVSAAESEYRKTGKIIPEQGLAASAS